LLRASDETDTQGCEMSKQGCLFGRPLYWPDWYRPSKHTPRKNERVMQGLHPMGSTQGPEGSSCGTCKHLRKADASRVHYKCFLVKNTASIATDIRLKWRGCSHWEVQDEGSQ